MGNPSGFIIQMARNKLAKFIFFLVFVVFICAYSLWKPLWDAFGLDEGDSYRIFFAGIAAGFVFYGLAFFIVKYNKWRWIPMLAWSIALSRVIFEIYSPKDAQTYYFWEYFFFVLSALMVFGYWVKYRWNK